jgi:hypothetical protein
MKKTIETVSETLLSKYSEEVARVRKRTFGLDPSLIGSDMWKARRLMTNIIVGGGKEENALQAIDMLFYDAVFETWDANGRATGGSHLVSIRALEIFREKEIKWPEKRLKYLNSFLQQYPKTPETREELEKLPGVGRHTASVFMALALNKNEFGVDMHVERISKRLRLVDKTTSVKDIEKIFVATIGENLGSLSRAFVEFGQRICAFVPLCADCPFASSCPSGTVKVTGTKYQDGTYPIQSSDGKTMYNITVLYGTPIFCECKGFQYHRTCSHIREQLPILVRNW